MKNIIILLFFSLFFIISKADNIISNQSSSEVRACIKGNVSNSENGILGRINNYIDIYNFCRSRNKFDNLEEYLLYLGNIKK